MGDIFRDAHAPQQPMAKVQAKPLICSCGSNGFIMYPTVNAWFNFLSPQEVVPNPVGWKFQCDKCRLWAALRHGPEGSLPKWVFITQEEYEAQLRPKPDLKLVAQGD